MRTDPDTLSELYEERLSIMLADDVPDAEQLAWACVYSDTVPAPAPVAAQEPMPAPVPAVALRPYQQAAVKATLAALGRGEHPVIALPTGSGKSLVLAALCAQLPGRLLVVTHRKKLLEQDSAQLTRLLGLSEDIGIYSAGLNQRDTHQRILLGGVHSIYKRMALLSEAGPFQYILIDECHLVGHKGQDIMYNTVLAHAPDAQRIGLSATPSRSGAPIWSTPEAWFTTCPVSLGIDVLTPDYLAPLSGILTASDVDLSRVRIRLGEYAMSDASQVLSEESVARAAIAEITDLAQYRQAWAVFCCDIAHTNLVAQLLTQAGIATGIMHSERTGDSNDAALAAFEAGKTRALVSCLQMTTGFDVPSIDCIVLLRPTMSKELLIQMLGRGTRKSQGKTDCLVLDFCHNLDRHAPLDALAELVKTPQRQAKDDERERQAQEDQGKERQAKHAKSVLAGQVFAVQRVAYRVVESKRQPGKALLEVSYYCPTRPGAKWVKQWLCLEYTGFARQQAEAWFTRREAVAPRSAQAGRRVAEGLPMPEDILVRADGQWDRIVMEFF